MTLRVIAVLVVLALVVRRFRPRSRMGWLPAVVVIGTVLVARTVVYLVSGD